MATIEQVDKFLLSGGIYSTVPRWENIYEEDEFGRNIFQTIQDYYPNTGKGYKLTLDKEQKDPADPKSWIVKYVDFGLSWKPATKEFMRKLEFDWDDSATSKYLHATNVSADKSGIKIGIPSPNNWEIEKFVISYLEGGQLAVWVRWYRGAPTDPIEHYKSGYIWPDC